MQINGFLLAHKQPILEKAVATDAECESQNRWWADALEWKGGIGYRKDTSAVDAKPFLFACASAFCKAACATGTSGPSCTLKSDPVQGCVKLTMDQLAFASYKVSLLVVSIHRLCMNHRVHYSRFLVLLAQSMQGCHSVCRSPELS